MEINNLALFRGTYKYKDVFEDGKQQSREKLYEIGKTLEPEDACNIQFTSVSTYST